MWPHCRDRTLWTKGFGAGLSPSTTAGSETWGEGGDPVAFFLENSFIGVLSAAYPKVRPQLLEPARPLSRD